MNPATLVALGAFPQSLEAFFDAIPADFRNWKPASWEGIPSEPFSPIEQIRHVLDVEVDGYHERFRLALGETRPILQNIDGEALSIERNYAVADPSEVFATFRSARRKTLGVISALTAEQLDRTAVFDDVPVSVRGLVHLLCSHDQQHLAGLQWLAARIDGFLLSQCACSR
ncbi:DinB family protein [Pseudoxanthomonas gei]|uniref:DinB family protein n=1 Tax=Pseudoxanthomonas gei TaxID=1383030 RepID=A0ABX0AGN0_9GAMM|nr:DinB family protein [Pseudoxanthomonas gei]NDK40038.1 DinB family protein [Pseudoxanthomonas gei]